MSSLGVAAITPIAGDKTGAFLDDLTNPNVGEWPKTDHLGKITNIAVYAGAIIDSVRITYSGAGTVIHGGTGGAVALSHALSVNEKLVAVYGRRLRDPGEFGRSNIVQLSFVLATSGANPQGAATCHVLTATAVDVTKPNIQFDFSWSLAGVASYSFKPINKPNSYLQGLGFTEVLSQI